MFSHRRQLRLWAARVLLLWLFGLGLGVAHACKTPGTGAPGAHHGAAPNEHAAAAEAGLHRHGDDAAMHQGSVAKTNCQDFCEKAAVSMPPLKSATGDLQSPAVIPLAAMTALPLPDFAPVQPWVPRRDGAQPPPIPIAFLRLAL